MRGTQAVSPTRSQRNGPHRGSPGRWSGRRARTVDTTAYRVSPSRVHVATPFLDRVPPETHPATSHHARLRGTPLHRRGGRGSPCKVPAYCPEDVNRRHATASIPAECRTDPEPSGGGFGPPPIPEPCSCHRDSSGQPPANAATARWATFKFRPSSDDNITAGRGDSSESHHVV